MYLIGYIKVYEPNLLINPSEVKSIYYLYNWINSRYSHEDFKSNEKITIEGISRSMDNHTPVILWLQGIDIIYGVIYGSKNNLLDNYKVLYFNPI